MAAATTTALKIINALGDYLKRNPATITAAHHLRDDLGLDSMAVIELLFRIEEAFDIQIPDQDLVGLATVGDVITYVDKRLGPPPPIVASKTASHSKNKKRS